MKYIIIKLHIFFNLLVVIVGSDTIIHSHTINTVTKLKVNSMHNFKDNLIFLLYGLPTSVANIEDQLFFKMATYGFHSFSKSLWPPIY